jgi:hypothetical protein
MHPAFVLRLVGIWGERGLGGAVEGCGEPMVSGSDMFWRLWGR